MAMTFAIAAAALVLTAIGVSVVRGRNAADATARFDVHPGRPEGYAGFTDHHAMRATLNGDLIARSPEAQFALVGLGVGLLDDLLPRLRDRTMPTTVAFGDIPDSGAAAVRWLGVMQATGTDTAAPSTLNLHAALQESSVQLCTTGPIMSGYWAGESEADERGGDMPPEVMQALRETYARNRATGADLARKARIA